MPMASLRTSYSVYTNFFQPRAFFFGIMKLAALKPQISQIWKKTFY